MHRRRCLHGYFIARGVVELVFEEAERRRGLDGEVDLVFEHPLPTAAIEAFGDIGVDVGVGDDGEAFLVLGGDEVAEVGLDVVDHDEARLDGSGAVAEGAFFLYVDLDGGTDALTGYLHQSELAEWKDGVASLVARHLGAHEVVELFAVFGLGEVYEVDDDNATHVAQAQLAGYFFCRLEIDLQGGVFLTLTGFDVVAAVDVDDVHGFGVLDVEIDTGADGDDAAEGPTDVAGDPEVLEDGCFHLVVVDYVDLVGGDGVDVLAHLVVDVLVVDVYVGEVVGEDVAQERGGGAELGDEFLGAGDVLEALGEVFPLGHELAQVGIEFGNAFAFGNGAHDDSEVFGLDALDQAAETVAFFAAFDFLRDGDAVDEGGQHQVAACKGDVAREFGAFGGDGFLGDLGKHQLAEFQNVGQVAVFLEDGFDFEVLERYDRVVAIHRQLCVFHHRVVVGAEVEVVHEAVFVLAHVDECGVEAGHDFAHLANIDVADLNLVAGLVLVKLDQLLVFG